MTRFLDGPAAGEVLMLRRAPYYLRATQNALSGDWDALDLLKDTPDPTELLIVAYRRVGERTSIHIDTNEKGRRVGRWYQGGSYELVSDQPSDDVLRDTEKWRAWCWEQVEAIRTPEVRGLIDAIDRGDAGLFPILADALEEAGCRDDGLLRDLRAEHEHATLRRRLRMYAGGTIDSQREVQKPCDA